MSATVSEAGQARIERAIDAKIDAFIESRLAKADLAAPISVPAKVKLRGILKKYSREAHPFRACVRDNAVRFGPGRVEAVCATLKDPIKGIKGMVKGSKAAMTSEDIALDGEVLLAIDAISSVDLRGIFMDARAFDEYGTTESVSLLEVSGADELRRWGTDGEVGLVILDAKKRAAIKPGDFVFPKDKSYPIHDRAHGIAALARSKGKPEEAQVKAAVCKRYSDLPACKAGGSSS